MYYPYLMTFKRKSIMKELDKTDLKILKFLRARQAQGMKFCPQTRREIAQAVRRNKIAQI